jgi:hypothetical protein
VGPGDYRITIASFGAKQQPCIRSTMGPSNFNDEAECSHVAFDANLRLRRRRESRHLLAAIGQSEAGISEK